MPETPGSRFSSGTITPSITISPVTEARRLSLFPILGVVRPAIPRSRMNPRTAPSCASDFAQTTMTSAIGLLLIHIFAPERR